MYFQIIYNLGIDLIFFDQELTVLQYVGASICIFFSLMAAIYKHRKNTQKVAAAELDKDKENNEVLETEAAENL